MKEIIILDKILAARHRPKSKTTLIRIFSSDINVVNTYPLLEHRNYFDNIFEYIFDDRTPKYLLELEESEREKVKLFSERDAALILDDFRKVMPVTDYLVVHCNAGLSRSPAVGAALNHIFCLSIPDEDYLDPQYSPNMHVYGTLVNVARTRLGLRFKSPWYGES